MGSVDRTTASGRRDYALLALMFNSGARVQEIVDLDARDLQLQSPPQITLVGKGRKTPNLSPMASDRKGAQSAHFRTRFGHEIQRANLLQSTRRAAHSLWHPLPSCEVLPRSGADISIVKPQAVAPTQRETHHGCFPSQIRRRFTLNQPLAGPCKRNDDWPLRKSRS